MLHHSAPNKLLVDLQLFLSIYKQFLPINKKMNIKKNTSTNQGNIMGNYLELLI